ncbi:MAG: aminotransferase class V-fold PLP-dependent enzyme [Chitinophagaceae bacterium]
MKRRDIIKSLSVLPLFGGIFSKIVPSEYEIKSPLSSKRDLFKELGVRTFINARGTITFMTGSLMHDYVLETIANSSKDFCMIDELQDKVGERIATMVHAEAATVTSGAFSALMLGMAGILTGTDKKKVSMLPRLEEGGMKSEVIIQKNHTIEYNHAFINCGAKLVYVETPDDVDKAVNEKTASMHFLNCNALEGKIMDTEWVALAKKYNLPATIDIAADVPPVSNLWKFNDMGFSFVALSGGKALRGPQSAGLLMGKKDIITGARLSAPPRPGTIGRGMKVNKEEILGMYVAVERYINQDHDKEWKEWEERVAVIDNVAKSVNGVITSVSVPPIANHTPTLLISWDLNKVKISGTDLLLALSKGNPSIEAYGGTKNSITVSPWMMRPKQEKIVALRIKEELVKASG